MSHDHLLDFYFAGDRLGAPFESAGNHPIPMAEMLSCGKRFPYGTDESDLVRNFVRFTQQYRWIGCSQHFAVEWAKFITANHRHTYYGKTWRALFSLVRFLRKNRKDITFDRLSRIATDMNSCGNGILALAYPAWRYANAVGADPFHLVRDLGSVSHPHELVRMCMGSLIWHFLTNGKTRPLAELILPEVCEPDYPGMTHLAPGCIWAAFECASGKSVSDVIRKACQISGDVDSYLSLALLLWGFRHEHRPS